MIGDFRLMNDTQNNKMYVINLSGEPPARGFRDNIWIFIVKVLILKKIMLPI